MDWPAHYRSRFWGRRIELGLDQAEVARRAGCSVSTISRIENLRADPSPKLLTALAQALRCTEDYLTFKVYDPKEHA